MGRISAPPLLFVSLLFYNVVYLAQYRTFADRTPNWLLTIDGVEQIVCVSGGGGGGVHAVHIKKATHTTHTIRRVSYHLFIFKLPVCVPAVKNAVGA